MTVLKWPFQSPGLNRIEHLWVVLDRRIRAKNIKNKEELLQTIQEEWRQILWRHYRDWWILCQGGVKQL